MESLARKQGGTRQGVEHTGLAVDPGERLSQPEPAGCEKVQRLKQLLETVSKPSRRGHLTGLREMAGGPWGRAGNLGGDVKVKINLGVRCGIGLKFALGLG